MPALGSALRKHLEPPLLQQAAFDDTVFKMDVMRNVGIRESVDEEPKSKEGKGRKSSLPVNKLYCYYSYMLSGITILLIKVFMNSQWGFKLEYIMI